MIRLPSMSFDELTRMVEQLKLLEVALAREVATAPSNLQLVHQWCETYRDLETAERARSYIVQRS